MDTLKMTDLIPDEGVRILFEDNHLLVAFKPAGVLSQSDGSDAPDMLTVLKRYLKIKYDKPGEVFLGLLHRLDRPVSGVMVFAKTSKCASRISEQIKTRKVTKRYHAVVNGIPGETSAKLTDYLLKDSKSNTTKVVSASVPGAKKAVLDYKVISSAGDKGMTFSLLDIELESGRGHQIRTQLSSRGHFIIGDMRYGDGKIKCDIALESYLIGFYHPVSKEYMEFSLPLKEDYPWSLFLEK